MNKEGNTYTFLYAGVMVVVVAAVLALLSQGLKGLQDENARNGKMIDILKSAGIEASSADVQAKFDKYIGKNAYAVGVKGEKVIADSDEAFSIDLNKELAVAENMRRLPVFECRLADGKLKYILPVRGKGLWGPIWGYIALNEDKKTIYGVTFGHQGETPGLGAKIVEQSFEAPFKGKEIFEGKKLVGITVSKKKVATGDLHSVDGISGGTITSKGVENMLLSCLENYENFLKQ